MKQKISTKTVRRISRYLLYLKSAHGDANTRISSPSLARAFDLGEVQVRKDLQQIARPGNCKTGRDRTELVKDLERCLGLSEPVKALYIGSRDSVSWLMKQCGGYLQVTLSYSPKDFLARYTASNPAALARRCRQREAELAIVDAEADQLAPIMEILTGSGIRAVWNFSPVPVPAQKDIAVCNESLIASLGVLSSLVRCGRGEPLKPDISEGDESSEGYV